MAGMDEIYDSLDEKRSYLLNLLISRLASIDHEEDWINIWGIGPYSLDPVFKVRFVSLDEDQLIHDVYKLMTAVRLVPGLQGLTHYDKKSETVMTIGDQLVLCLAQDSDTMQQTIREVPVRKALVTASAVLQGSLNFTEVYRSTSLLTKITKSELNDLETIEVQDIHSPSAELLADYF